MKLILPIAALTVLAGLAAAAEKPATQPSSRPMPVVACAFSPDGSKLVVARQNGVEIRSIGDRPSRRLDLDLPRVAAIAFDPAGKRLAIAGGIAGESGSVTIVDAGTFQPLTTIDGPADLATAVAFSPDGRLLAVGSGDRTCRLFRIVDRKGKPIAEPAAKLEGHGGGVTSVLFSPDSELVVTASIDRSIKVWKVADGVLVRTLGNHTDAVHTLAARPATGINTSWTIASASDDRTVRIWQPAIGRMVRIIRGHDGPVLAVAWMPDGKQLLSLGVEGVVRVIDGDGDQILQAVPAHADWGYALAVSPNGCSVASGGWAGDVKLLPMDARQIEQGR